MKEQESSHNFECVILGPPESSRYLCIDFDNSSLLNGVYISEVNVVVANFGFVGNSAYFNGVDAYIEIPLFDNNPLSKFTTCCWARRNCTGVGTRQQGILYNGDCVQNASIEIRSESTTTTGAGIRTSDTDAHNVFTGVPVSQQ
jgi:hypothetical protein